LYNSKNEKNKLPALPFPARTGREGQGREGRATLLVALWLAYVYACSQMRQAGQA